MAVRIRLSRHGRKGYAYYHIVVADCRAPRDGRFIERIGSYNPNVDPAQIVINSDRALYWLSCGAQPTDTCRNLLSKEGVLLRKHLNGGVAKGAFTQEQADAKFNAWKAEKDAQKEAKKQKVSSAKAEVQKARLAAETKVNASRAEALQKKQAEALAAKEAATKAAEAPEEAPAETPATEAPAETPAE